jgi:ubiquinone/menaquinone biosynthesis C-methylase UbiE
MDKPMPNWAFKGMSFMFRIRDLFESRARILEEVNLEPGFYVLDYGCGPGAYVSYLAERVGESGRVYALDLHPLAIERVQALARRRRLDNVETIRSDCATGLPDGSVDVVLLYDIFHGLSEPEAVLAELQRVLKVDGTLSVHDPHMREEDLLGGVTGSQRFALAGKGEKTYQFVKQ